MQRSKKNLKTLSQYELLKLLKDGQEEAKEEMFRRMALENGEGNGRKSKENKEP
ncbi:MAG: hypothetical protein XD58_0772 [Thermotoga sp. 50_1627]|uniref:hypothetical protein n=1 Tax=Pseudothermotoga sp. TaxID=2033661 RepID=UPI00076D94C3|nr:MAG: hypothetical protein XD45_0921 [Thermotoga sp. 50_64]KUK25264.1 MAG: hypothetical protein XD58_0772 [Thermotoga sp. 50_1627]MBC7116296.1 hypothetical protein [Pseudothermotoga sp.]MDK2922707.1 hypothetical protein [Pseudothermotoga sp.]